MHQWKPIRLRANYSLYIPCRFEYPTPFQTKIAINGSHLYAQPQIGVDMNEMSEGLYINLLVSAFM